MGLRYYLGAMRIHANWKLQELYYELNKKKFPNIEKFKGIYSGKSCFIVGNGPSLTGEDLDRIHDKGYVSFGMNRIYRIFDKTYWRPTYMSFSDEYFLSRRHIDEFDALVKVNSDMFFTRNQFAFNVRNTKCPICPLRTDWRRSLLDDPKFSLDISKVIYDIATVTYYSMQIAVYMGFKTLYLIGVDNRYAWTRLRDGTVIRNPGSFNYFKDEELPPPSTAVPVWESDCAFTYAEKFSRKHNFRIYNATRGGALEIFERVNLDEVLA